MKGRLGREAPSLPYSAISDREWQSLIWGALIASPGCLIESRKDV